MKVLVIKTSSMGDIIHTLPALSDALSALPDVQFDWLVEERFAFIPAWHPAVNRVIPIALRRWKRHKLRTLLGSELRQAIKQLRLAHYDYIIDAQGLWKSALWGVVARGKTAGFDRASVREPLAWWWYRRRIAVSKSEHAVTRIRHLFAKTLDYTVPNGHPRYGIDRHQFAVPKTHSPYVLFFHGTTWANKHWPELYWQQLIDLVVAQGFHVKLGWGGPVERERSLRLAKHHDSVSLLPDLTVAGVADYIAASRAVVAVDTGFAHLTEALDVPLVSLYGPTSPERTGPLGQRQVALAADFSCAPCYQRECRFQGPAEVTPACFARVTPAAVLRQLQPLLRS